MLCWEVRRLQLQVQETLAAVAFKTPIKFNIYGPPKADMNAPREARARGSARGEGDRKQRHLGPLSVSCLLASPQPPLLPLRSARPPLASVLSSSSSGLSSSSSQTYIFLRTCLSLICPPRNRVENAGLVVVSLSGSARISSSVFSAPWPATKLPGDVRLVLAVPLSSSSHSPSVCLSLGISPSAPFSLLSDCLRSNRRNRKIYEPRHAKLHKITFNFCF